MAEKPLFRFHKLRLLLGWIGGAFLLLTAHTSAQGFRMGIPLVVVGMLVRAWATGYIPRKSHELTTAGPFAYVRNPLYVGNFLLGLGVVAVVQNVLTAILFLLGFWILYRGTIHKEEGELAGRFGKSYEKYLAAVPRFVPRLTPYPEKQKNSYQWKLLWKHRELETLLAVSLVLTGLFLWQEIVQEGKFEWTEKAGLAVGLSLIAGLIAERAIRMCQKSKKPKVLTA